MFGGNGGIGRTLVAKLIGIRGGANYSILGGAEESFEGSVGARHDGYGQVMTGYFRVLVFTGGVETGMEELRGWG
jgi:hypothetical protein